MEQIPQSNQMNPAFQNPSTLYLGLPAGSSVHASLKSGFAFNDIFIYEEEIGRPVTFLYSEEYQDDFLKTFDRMGSFLSADLYETILSMGFRVKDFYFFGDANLRISGDNSLPADFPRLLLNGNYQDGQAIDYQFDDFNFNANAFIESGIGVSYKYNSKLTLGAKPKLLFGLGNLSTGDVSASLSSRDSLNLSANMTLNGAFPTLQLHEGDEFIDSMSISDDMGEIISESLTNKNKGFAIDLGATYQLNDQIRLSASLIDLGWISWKSNANSINASANYTFRGADVSSMLDADDTTDFFQSVTDTLPNLFQLSNELGGDYSYSTSLYGKFYLGGTYEVTKGIKLGVLSRTSIVNSKLRQQLTLSANFSPHDVLNASISYTMKNNTFNNLGLGLGLKGGPFHFYFVTDNIPIAFDRLVTGDGTNIPIPHNFKSVNLRFGFNLMFGYNRAAKKVDEPIIDINSLPEL